MNDNKNTNRKVNSLSSLNELLASSVVKNTEPVADTVEKEDNTVVSEEKTELTDDYSDEVNEPEESQEETATEKNEEVSDEVEVDIYSDWDKEDAEKETVPTTDSIDSETYLSELSKELGFEFKDKDSFINDIKNKLSGSVEKSSEDFLKELPDDLASAIKIAKDGGDYRGLLNISSIDYDSLTDEDLYANAIETHFTNKDGVIDDEGLNAHIDSLTETELRIKAGEIRQALKVNQENAKHKFINDQNEKSELNRKKINSALENFSEVNGFKVKIDDKKFIYDSVNNDTLIKNLFYGDNSAIDYDKVCDVVFKVRNFDKITSFLATKNRNEGKRSIIEKMTNPETKTKGVPVNTVTEQNPIKTQQQKWISSIRGF